MVEALLNPKSIAVVGVSTDQTKVGHQIFTNLLSFPGPVYPINPKHKKILGKTAYPSVLSIPQHVDLVVIATPMPTVEGIVNECIDKKVQGVIVITAGFAESSATGKKIQDDIAAKLLRNHIALLGPNTLGAVCPHNHLNASFSPPGIQAGNVALISQSGAMLTTIFSEFSSRQVGCSFALSLGNSAGVTVNDALTYAFDDPQTNVIALYLESVPDIPTFFSLCKKISKTKPIIFLKGGMSDEGQQASLSHTAALATDAVLLQEAQHQMGYTMVTTIEQFFETTFFLDSLYRRQLELPQSLMIITNAGGPGVNAVDLASSASIPLSNWGTGTVGRFARELPRVHPGNPTDLLGDASVRDISTALLFAAEDPLIDGVLLIITPQAVTDIPGIVAALGKLKFLKPLVVALMGGESLHQHFKKLRAQKITTVEYANEGVEIFAAAYHARLALHVDRSPALMSRIDTSRHVMSTPTVRTTRSQIPLSSNNLEEVLLLLEKYGLTLPRCAIVASQTQLDELDTLDPERVYPLIAKTTNLKLKHKAIVGAVIKDIMSKADAVAAFTALQRFGERMILQEVIEGATEVIIGMKRDEQFGSFLVVGAGGSLTNIIADRSYIFIPGSPRELRATFKRTKIFQILSPEQRSVVLLTLERIMLLTEEHPEIRELEINPLMVTAHTAYVADIKVDLKVLS